MVQSVKPFWVKYLVFSFFIATYSPLPQQISKSELILGMYFSLWPISNFCLHLPLLHSRLCLAFWETFAVLRRLIVSFEITEDIASVWVEVILCVAFLQLAECPFPSPSSFPWQRTRRWLMERHQCIVKGWSRLMGKKQWPIPLHVWLFEEGLIF